MYFCAFSEEIKSSSFRALSKRSRSSSLNPSSMSSGLEESELILSGKSRTYHFYTDSASIEGPVIVCDL